MHGMMSSVGLVLLIIYYIGHSETFPLVHNCLLLVRMIKLMCPWFVKKIRVIVQNLLSVAVFPPCIRKCKKIDQIGPDEAVSKGQLFCFPQITRISANERHKAIVLFPDLLIGVHGTSEWDEGGDYHLQKSYYPVILVLLTSGG